MIRSNLEELKQNEKVYPLSGSVDDYANGRHAIRSSGDQYLVLDPKGPIGESQKDLIWITVWLCAIILVPVLILTAYIVWRYRDKKGNKAGYQPNWEHSTKLETIWWAIPIIIIAILATVTIKYTYDLEPSKPLESAKEPITIEATSLDWKWLFTYRMKEFRPLTTFKFLRIRRFVSA